MKNRAEQLMESYFQGALSPEEDAELKALLRADSTLAGDFALQAQLSRHAGLAGKHNPMKERLRQVQQHMPEKRQPGFRQFLLWGSLALLLLTAIGLWVRQTTQQPPAPPPANAPMPPPARQIQPASPAPASAPAPAPAVETPVRKAPVAAVPRIPGDTLIQNYFRHYPNKVTIAVAGAEDTIPATVSEAFRAYDSRNYHDAVPKLRSLTIGHPEKFAYKFYYGVALVGDKQFATAIGPLAQLTRFDNDYKAAALYYLSLAYIGTGRHHEAKQALEAYLADPAGIPYRRYAEQLLQRL